MCLDFLKKKYPTDHYAIVCLAKRLSLMNTPIRISLRFTDLFEGSSIKNTLFKVFKSNYVGAIFIVKLNVKFIILNQYFYKLALLC